MKKTLFVLLIAIVIVSCSRNRLKTDEKLLEKQILTEEQQQAHEERLRMEREKQLADSIAKLPKGFRFKENRSTAPEHPPVVIDIAENRKHPQEIKLSQLFSRVEYIRLEPVPDSVIASGFSHFEVGGKHIYGFSFQLGIVQFSLDGKFIGFVCKNKLPVTRGPDGRKVYQSSNADAKVAWQMFYADGILCYKYLDREKGTTSYYQFEDKQDCAKTIVLPMKEGDKVDDEPQGVKYAQFSDKFVSKSTTLYPLPWGMKAQVQNRKPIAQSLPLVDVLSASGDTVCSFQDNDPIQNYSKSLTRGVDRGDAYYCNKILHLRQAFNDTIYYLVPPNRLVPKYIFDYGDRGIPSAYAGIDPGFDLTDKLILKSCLETSRYLFITYSKDYACPNTAKSGSLKYSRLVYHKKAGVTQLVYVDEAPLIPEKKMWWPLPPELNLENDLDSMPIKWPQYSTAGGQPFAVFSGKELLEKNPENLPLKDLSANDQIIAIYH